MDILYRLGKATAAEVRSAMGDPPSYSAVRALLTTLVRKNAVVHEQEGRRYVYRPAVSADAAGRSALRRVVDAFFDGAAVEAALALLRLEGRLDEDELARLETKIREAEADEEAP